MTRWHCCMRLKAEGNSASGHPQHRSCDSFDFFTERYKIVVLPNSELTKGNNKHDADVRTGDGIFKLPITSLFVIRNIECGHSFS